MSDSESNQTTKSVASSPFPSPEKHDKPSAAAENLMKKWRDAKDPSKPQQPLKKPKPPSLDSATVGTQSPVQRYSFELTTPKPKKPKNVYTKASNILPEHPKLTSMSIDDLSEAIQPSRPPIPAKSKIWEKVTRWLAPQDEEKKSN